MVDSAEEPKELVHTRLLEHCIAVTAMPVTLNRPIAHRVLALIAFSALHLSSA